MNKVDIILVLYGERADLDECIKSIEENCNNYNIIIIDNNEKNRGFTKACNEGIQKGNAPYIWLLNQDAIVLPNAQETLIKRLETHEKIGIAGSMQLDPDDPDLIRHSGTIRCFPAGQHSGGRLSMGHGQIPSKQKWVNGASLMMKRSVYDKIGPLDESMFLLYSESDYCYMVRDSGFEVWYEPNSRIYHKLGKASKFSQEWQQKDMIAFMKKWGIRLLQNNRFEYSHYFQKLDLFP